MGHPQDTVKMVLTVKDSTIIYIKYDSKISLVIPFS